MDLHREHMTLRQRLNVLSHEFGFDTPRARLLGEAATRIQDLEKALSELVEYQGHIALNSVGDVRMQMKLMRARENAQKLLEAGAGS